MPLAHHQALNVLIAVYSMDQVDHAVQTRPLPVALELLTEAVLLHYKVTMDTSVPVSVVCVATLPYPS